ncbi:aspartic peptidase domain-containing protein [Xylariaceae sp. FL0255]|nr:aspartic peptidase domain-containing protein [Xylariaceae sp. FL0255]
MPRNQAPRRINSPLGSTGECLPMLLSRNAVMIASNDSSDFPVVDPNWLSSPTGADNHCCGIQARPGISTTDVLQPIRAGPAIPDLTTVSTDTEIQDWLINVTLGTPPQSFFVFGDTGSVNLAFGSTLLPEDQQSSSPKYNPNASSTAQEVEGYTYRSCFVSGYCSEDVVFQDVFTVGDLVIDNEEFGVQTNNNKIGSGARTGTLGLDFDHNGQTTKPNKTQSWLQNIMPRLESGVFTVDYNRNTSNRTYDFGYIDSSKYSGSIGYAPIVENSTAWAVNITGLELANGTMAATQGWLTTIDTGTVTAGFPTAVAADYFSQIQGAVYHVGAKRYEYPCSSPLVDFTFAIDSFRGIIPAVNLGAESIDNGTTCITKLNVDASDDKSLWGEALIQEFFVIFDWDNARLGFAAKGTSASDPEPTSAGTVTTPRNSSGFYVFQVAVIYIMIMYC